MKIAHRLGARVLCQPNETADFSVALKELLSCKAQRDIEIYVIEPEEGTTTALVQSSLSKESDINQLVKYIVANLPPEEKSQLCQEAESRVDEHCDFFLRLDKNEWMGNRKLKLTSSGNCFHLTFAMAAYPKTKERAIMLVKQIFKTG
jgi:RNA binding exosome subunit